MKTPNPRGRPSRQEISMIVEEEAWKNAGSALSEMRRGVRLSLLRAKGSAPRRLTVLLTSDSRVRALNGQYRRKNKPTNVLSFPSALPDYLGDIAIAYGVTAQEAQTAGKDFADHAVHLAVHGVLHLLGYDHIKPKDANRMETIEREILAEIGIADPYRQNVA